MFLHFRPVAGAVAMGIALALVPATIAEAQPGQHNLFPTTIPLPDGFQPEGIAIGSKPIAYVGSLVDGDLYRFSLITGEGEVFSQGPGTPSVGMKIDKSGRLFVAGGSGGDARVVDARTGEILASYVLNPAGGFINDVLLTRDAAWFTDSTAAQLFKLPLGKHGALPDQSAVETLPLTGEWVQDPAGFNANGIAPTPDGSALLVVNLTTGLLYRVDPATGEATTVDLGGYLLTNGDGLLLQGRTLFATRNRDNILVEIRLNRAGTAGVVVDEITSPAFDVPTTIAAFGGRLYLPNARFTTPPTPTTTYNVVAIRP
jgi:sugar lactone lactonase YvrE